MSGVRVDDLTDLWRNGAVDLPQVAVQYTKMARELHMTSVSETQAFSRSARGLRRLYHRWTRLRNLVQDDIAVRSHDNLVAAGEALMQIAERYATADYLNAEQLAEFREEINDIENSEDEYRRPPYVPAAPSSDDEAPDRGYPSVGTY